MVQGIGKKEKTTGKITLQSGVTRILPLYSTNLSRPTLLYLKVKPSLNIGTHSLKHIPYFSLESTD